MAKQIPVDEQLESLTINPYLEVYHTTDSLGPDQVLEKIANGEIKVSENTTSPGFSSAYYWLKFQIEQTSNQELLLELDNPHIDYVYLFEVKDSAELVGWGGDKWKFSNRTIKNRRYLFPVGEADYLMMVDKRNAAVSFPLKLWSRESFYVQESFLNLIFGNYFGILVFISAFSLIVGLALKERHFLSYSLYVGVLMVYMFTQLGLSFEYLYPDSSVLNNYSRLVLAYLLIIASMDFFSKLLEIESYLPKLDKFYRGGWLFLLVTIVFWIVNRLFNPNYAVLTIYVINILYILIFVFFITIFYVSYKTWHQQKGNILLVLAAFFALMIGSVTYILVEYGVIPESSLPVNPIMIGSAFEVLILSLSMVFRVKRINDRKNDLTDRLLRQQKEMMRAYIHGVDSERQRISAELHDNIGSGLSILKKKIERKKSSDSEITTDIDVLCKEVRGLSHQLLPHQMQMMGVAQVIKDYVKRFGRDTGIKVMFESFDLPRIDESISNQMLRIVQEALQNILNHSQASEAEVQMIGHSGELTLTIDDNGVGFDTSKTHKGKGLLSMRSRVQAMHGTIDISSKPKKGTNILIIVPILDHSHDQ